MIHLLSSFLLTDIQQVQSRLLKDGFGLEGNIFNCKLLDSEQTWKTISSNIRFINNKYGNVIKSLHFPIDQADYLTDSKVRKILFRFIDLANDYRIPIVVLHSNCIKDIESYSIKKLKGIRREYIDFYKTVDKYLDIKNTKVTIENMPIIGDHGVDFDSVFVFPSDFSDLDFKNIYVTWDIGHWAYTFYTCQTLNNFSEKITIEKTEFSDYLQIPYVPGSGELSVFCAALVGGSLGFLWYNCFPAQIFMGDTGSLTLGGMLGLVAIIVKQELLMVIIGGIFVAEAVSVLVQKSFYKMTKRRVFRCAPLHHHFQFMGWPETKITLRFCIIAAMLAVFSLILL